MTENSDIAFRRRNAEHTRKSAEVGARGLRSKITQGTKCRDGGVRAKRGIERYADRRSGSVF